MEIQIRVPEVGESVREAVLAEWYRRDGDFVRKGDPLFAIETDKVTLEVPADADGVLKILVREGKTVAVGSVVGILDTAAASGEAPGPHRPAQERQGAEPLAGTSEPARAPAPGMQAPAVGTAPPAAPSALTREPGRETLPARELPPSVERFAAEKGIDVSQVTGSGPGGRITKGDMLLFLEESARAEVMQRVTGDGTPPGDAALPRALDGGPSGTLIGSAPGVEDHAPSAAAFQDHREPVRRQPMSRIRLRIAERLLEARQNTAMLTTFNEIDMSRVQAARARFKESFLKKYGVSLGIMSFFVKASIVALKEFPEVNASIDGKDIVYHDYYHIGIAVGAKRGLVVPVIRHADRLSFAEIEKAVKVYADKIGKNLLQLSDLEGGTFSISNGGVYGSLMSTPILNTPQSGILGMHKIEDRPVAVDGQIVIRPMMYVALSYDHRLIDGREAVEFLKRTKECVENPERIVMEI
jgi:2-oxoglutarate dehydrogenase E2 component (dihydrolipoamide succinyltransferase)